MFKGDTSDELENSESYIRECHDRESENTLSSNPRTENLFYLHKSALKIGTYIFWKNIYDERTDTFSIEDEKKCHDTDKDKSTEEIEDTRTNIECATRDICRLIRQK